MHRGFRTLAASLTLLAPFARGESLTNPSFAITTEQAVQQLEIDARTPKKLERPLVIVGGFLDVGIGPMLYQRRIEPQVRGPILRVVMADCLNFPQCRRRLVSRVDERFGIANDKETVEVDVVGISMGGLVGLYSSFDDPTLGKRLKVRRLFTLSSPLQGARRAAKMPFNLISLIHDMRPGSLFYSQVAHDRVDCELYSYTMLHDPVVGEPYASLPGRGVWWLEPPAGAPAHEAISWDRRVLLDVSRRLRGENPVAMSPPAPLPTTRPADHEER